jgi:hypothetical protein
VQKRLFVGSPIAGKRAAVLMSMIASCKANMVEHLAWLRDVLTQLPLGTAPQASPIASDYLRNCHSELDG